MRTPAKTDGAGACWELIGPDVWKLDLGVLLAMSDGERSQPSIRVFLGRSGRFVMDFAHLNIYARPLQATETEAALAEAFAFVAGWVAEIGNALRLMDGAAWAKAGGPAVSEMPAVQEAVARAGSRRRGPGPLPGPKALRKREELLVADDHCDGCEEPESECVCDEGHEGQEGRS